MKVFIFSYEIYLTFFRRLRIFVPEADLMVTCKFRINDIQYSAVFNT